jgi:5-methylcytosine-specific restriction protein A
MPRAPKKCGRDGCETRVTGRKFCDEHTEHGWTSRGQERTSTTAHKHWRLAVLNRDGWTCQIRSPRCTGRANTADHIIAVALGGKADDINNGQAACTRCNQWKASREGLQARTRR